MARRSISSSCASARIWYDVTPDGQRFLILQRAAAASELQLVLVQNWLEDVKRLTARK